jgi:hypothetical protein
MSMNTTGVMASMTKPPVPSWSFNPSADLVALMREKPQAKNTAMTLVELNNRRPHLVAVLKSVGGGSPSAAGRCLLGLLSSIWAGKSAHGLKGWRYVMASSWSAMWRSSKPLPPMVEAVNPRSPRRLVAARFNRCRLIGLAVALACLCPVRWKSAPAPCLSVAVSKGRRRRRPVLVSLCYPYPSSPLLAACSRWRKLGCRRLPPMGRNRI